MKRSLKSVFVVSGCEIGWQRRYLWWFLRWWWFLTPADNHNHTVHRHHRHPHTTHPHSSASTPPPPIKTSHSSQFSDSRDHHPPHPPHLPWSRRHRVSWFRSCSPFLRIRTTIAACHNSSWLNLSISNGWHCQWRDQGARDGQRAPNTPHTPDAPAPYKTSTTRPSATGAAAYSDSASGTN